MISVDAGQHGSLLLSCDRQTALPRHGTDIGPYLINKILKDLGIEKEKK